MGISNSISTALEDNTQVVTYRSLKNIVVKVQNPGKATFTIYGKAIPGCKNIAAVGRGASYTVTCAWRPSTRGTVTVSVLFKPTTSAQPTLTSLLMNIIVGSRTNLR